MKTRAAGEPSAGISMNPHARRTTSTTGVKRPPAESSLLVARVPLGTNVTLPGAYRGTLSQYQASAASIPSDYTVLSGGVCPLPGSTTPAGHFPFMPRGFFRRIRVARRFLGCHNLFRNNLSPGFGGGRQGLSWHWVGGTLKVRLLAVPLGRSR